MKIDLLDFVDYNKRIDSLRIEADFREELNSIIAAIIKGEIKYYTSNDTLIENVGLKAKQVKEIFITREWPYKKPDKYIIELNKANIKRVQKYIDNETYEKEDEY